MARLCVSLLAVVTVIAACVLQPSQAAPLSVSVGIGTQMRIRGSRPPSSHLAVWSCCVELPADAGNGKTVVRLKWQQATSTNASAPCTTIQFFSGTLGCTGNASNTLVVSKQSSKKPAKGVKYPLCVIAQFASLRAHEWVGGLSHLCFPFPPSALRCAADDICKYASCPANSTCFRSTFDGKKKPQDLSPPQQHLPVKPPQQLLVEPLQQLPVNPQQQLPVKPPQQLPVKPPQQLPVKPPQQFPVKPPQQLPVKPPQQLPVKPPQQLPVKPPQQLPVKPPQQLPVKQPQQLPVKPPQQLPRKRQKLRAQNLPHITHLPTLSVIEPSHKA
ncbi:unnamed protein product [Closterium sp. Yama58-4]|nr:unnamed protein product [Closterium sp. Yama58-4]